MNLLLIEDEIRVQNFLAEALRQDGYKVSCCSNYDETLALLANAGKDLDLVLMDRLLGRVDAITLLPVIRTKCPNARVLVLSTVATGAQKAAVLDMGADDYMGKPFELVELKARLRLLARRGATPQSPENTMHRLTCGDLVIDLLEHKIWCNEKLVDLSNKEFQLLLTLVRQPGRVFSKFQLLDTVWSTQFEIESNVVEVTIRNLRKKLEDANSTVEILSRRNIGYWIEA